MSTAIRIDAETAIERVNNDTAVLVCAYDDQAKCERLRLDGALTLPEFRERLDEISNDTEIIFYCG